MQPVNSATENLLVAIDDKIQDCFHYKGLI